MKNVILNFDEIDNFIDELSKFFLSGGVLGLIGDLGTGKTTIAKKIAKNLGITQNVKSPTFTYVLEYETEDIKLYHFDVYRITNSEEIYEIGFEDYLADRDAVIIIEWADKIIDELPEEALFLELAHISEDKRSVSLYKLKNGEKKYVNIFNNNNNKNI